MTYVTFPCCFYVCYLIFSAFQGILLLCRGVPFNGFMVVFWQLLPFAILLYGCQSRKSKKYKENSSHIFSDWKIAIKKNVMWTFFFLLQNMLIRSDWLAQALLQPNHHPMQPTKPPHQNAAAVADCQINRPKTGQLPTWPRWCRLLWNRNWKPAWNRNVI